MKIISSAAKEIKYYRLYGMNTTIIRIGSGNDAGSEPQKKNDEE